MQETASFRAGAKAALNGTHIDNSYPWDHEEWVEGYRSVKPEAQETLWLKNLFTKAFPKEYAKDNPEMLKHREEINKITGVAWN